MKSVGEIDEQLKANSSPHPEILSTKVGRRERKHFYSCINIQRGCDAHHRQPTKGFQGQKTISVPHIARQNPLDTCSKDTWKLVSGKWARRHRVSHIVHPNSTWRQGSPPVFANRLYIKEKQVPHIFRTGGGFGAKHPPKLGFYLPTETGEGTEGDKGAIFLGCLHFQDTDPRSFETNIPGT